MPETNVASLVQIKANPPVASETSNSSRRTPGRRSLTARSRLASGKTDDGSAMVNDAIKLFMVFLQWVMGDRLPSQASGLGRQWPLIYTQIKKTILFTIFSDCPRRHRRPSDDRRPLTYTHARKSILLAIFRSSWEIVRERVRFPEAGRPLIIAASVLKFAEPGLRERLGPRPARTTRRIVTIDPTVMTPTIGPHLAIPGLRAGGMTPHVFDLGCPQTPFW